MRINIKKSSAKFYINKEKRAVTCVLPCDPFMLLDYIEDFGIFPRNNRDFRLPRFFSAVAFCAEGDEWDEEIGKLAAYNKAKRHLIKELFARMNLLFKQEDKKLDDLYNSFNALGEKWSANLEKNDKLLHK